MTRNIFSLVLAMLMATFSLAAQQITVHGTVLSKTDGEPLIGASVQSEANNQGVVTNFDGEFMITVPEKTNLVVSYIGYNTAIVEAVDNITIELEENSALLDEVVVVGYSAEKKADLTGSVSVVKMKDVTDTPTGNVMQALQGRVAGMNIVTDDIPAPTTNNANNEHELSRYYIEDGSFLRLKTLTVGYTLPQSIQKKLSLANARVYFQAQNVFTITKYSGADPEGLGYPYSIPRSYTFGIQFGF